MEKNNFTPVEEQIKLCLAHYYNLVDVQILALSSGMNNITRVIKTEEHTYNLRIYCNHQDKQKVSFEHSILFQLLAGTFPLEHPIPVKTRFGSSVAELEDGRLVALYSYIEGSQQASENLYLSLIEATAHLSKALDQIKLVDQGEYSPYYELETNYPSFTEEQFNQWRNNGLQDRLYQMLLTLNDTRAELENKKELFKALPHQFIHGDINFSNSVSRDNSVIGLLDFEFVTYDLRVMELAVVLIELFKQSGENKRERLKHYLACYTRIHQLTEEELELLPDLVKLRAIDVAFHFMTRYAAGMDELSVLQHIVKESYLVVQEVNRL